MPSGERAFSGESAASLIASVLEREPPSIDLPGPLDRVLRTCLAKDTDARFQAALDLKRALLWAAEEGLATRKASSCSSRVWPIAAAGLALLAVGLGWLLWQIPGTTPTSPLTRITRDGRSISPALSPHGKLLAEGKAPLRIADDPAFDGSPAFSADGSKIYFPPQRDPSGIYEISAG